jgi:hypothetical protein
MTLTESMRVRDRVRAWKRESMTLIESMRVRDRASVRTERVVRA